jgi:hypothetical protein
MTQITKWAGTLCLTAAALIVSSELLRLAVGLIGAEAPEVLKLPPGGSVLVGALITVGLFAAGWITFGVAALRSGVFSRPAAALLVVGGACGVLALSTPYQIPLALAVGWIGYTLIRASRYDLPVPRTTPASSVVGELQSR